MKRPARRTRSRRNAGAKTPPRARTPAEPLYREIEHAADLAVEIEADSVRDLFRRAALALFSLLVELHGVETRGERTETVRADGYDDLLHDWLSRLLTSFFIDGFLAREVSIDLLEPSQIRARLRGEKFDLERHRFRGEIKAVTYHGLSVVERAGRWRARVIFDV